MDIKNKIVRLTQLSLWKREVDALSQQIAALQQEMQKAIDSQNFEQAAVLRDKIKELKGDAEK